MTTQFQPGEYLTRDGRKARVYATDGCGNYRVHGAILINPGWQPELWDVRGVHPYHTTDDLMPPKQVRYCNFYGREYSGIDVGYPHPSREHADKHAWSHRIACIRIEFTEGQYDD